MEEVTYAQFVAHLRRALHYLYDPVHLRDSPLIDLLGLTREFDRAATLHEVLSKTIRALKPGEDEPPQARAWRLYDTLNFLYVRQLGREAVATQLGISERQLRREQRVTLEVLAQQLWTKINPTASPVQRQATLQPQAEGITLSYQKTDHTLSEELGWLKKSADEPRVALREALYTVDHVAQPLAHQWQTPLQIHLPPEVADIPVASLALRSILLTILSVAIPRAGERPVVISATTQGATVECTVSCCNQGDEHARLSESDSNEDAASLQTAQTLAAFYGAQLCFPQREGMLFTATLTLPSPAQVSVLVIDDNGDWIELLQRYAAGSRYQVTGSSDPTTARERAGKLQPALIVLDVMMHHVDGWQILSELRHDPLVAQTPIIICTILPVKELALSLGANAFLQKPVTQHRFLTTLDQQSGLAERRHTE